MNEMNEILSKTMDDIYYYKDRPYMLLYQSHIKVGDSWNPVVVYKTMYYNENGEIWVRSREEFFSKFIPFKQMQINITK